MSQSSSLDSPIASRPVAERVVFLVGRRFAHRGLHGGPVVENSRAAFAAAIANGDGIELDVRSARDGGAFVFHDRTLDRLTGEAGELSTRTATDLDRILLKGTNETIPRLPEILDLVGGKVPLLIEAKTRRVLVGPLCRAVRHALEGYGGEAGIMSFNPAVGRWFRRNAPHIARGLIIMGEKDRHGFAALRGRVARRLSLWQARPDFLAYDIRDLPSAFAARRRQHGLKLVTWTVRTAAEGRLALAHADAIIYEKPRPGAA